MGSINRAQHESLRTTCTSLPTCTSLLDARGEAAGHTCVVIRSLDDDDSQEAGAVHAVDADQLDVGGRRAAGDPGHRAGGVLAEDLDGLGHRGDDVGGLEDDDVGVGYERDRAATVSAILRT